MTQRRWLMAGAGALVLALLVTVGILALRPDGQDPDRAAPPIPDAERLFLPGYDDSPGDFTMTPVTEAEGPAITVDLALPEGAAHREHVVGLSFDARDLDNPMWSSSDSNLALTLDALEEPALRFGGNGIDRSVWWTSAEEPAPDWAEVTLTPEDLQRVASVAEQVDAQVTIDLDLGHDDPERAADMAAHAQEAFGDQLLAVAIGNEPNGFFHDNQPQLAVRDESWTPQEYQRSLREYSAALEQAAPGIPVAGPGAYDAQWWRAFATSDIPHQEALSLHWYPLWECQGPDTSDANPSIEDLTSPVQRERAAAIVGRGAGVADRHELPLWMEETGPTSCPGTNDTSRTHAQALWTVDYTMTLAELGVTRTAFHSTLHACRGGAPMSPICATGPHAEPGQIIRGRSSFLALMLLDEVPAGRILSTEVSGDGTTSVHAVLAEDGALTLVLVDLRDPADGEAAARPVEVTAPEALGAVAADGWELSRGAQLTGASLEAQESSAAGLAPVAGELAGARLALEEPLTLTSDPGTVTVLELAATEGGASDGGGGTSAR
ncbi:hypothetical protein [Brachybacterium sp. YJGR34]|uniref:hypothetical protein n=1 Tax=Brachybacterium sp. YJGR34 TaxID=2059911 RepID=UPI000E0BFF81|nr:hypothetical protein [Brachybacterium sp. YJGR34]